MNSINLSGLRFGLLKVICVHSCIKNKARGWSKYWRCRCDCGKTCKVAGGHLRSGHTTSCGCARIRMMTKHGCSRSPEYIIFWGMRQRCLNKKCNHFNNYGGRGIKICKRWNRFENFIKDMGNRPSPLHTLERKDNGGDYKPSNCRWATKKEQSNNRRTNRFLSFDGQTMTISEWALRMGMNAPTIRYRLSIGKTVEEAFSNQTKCGRGLVHVKN